MAVDQIFINKTNVLVQLVGLKHCGDNLNYQTKSKTKVFLTCNFSIHKFIVVSLLNLTV